MDAVEIDRRILSKFHIRPDRVMSLRLIFFFFQAEDGIRAGRVTGVQTCALPIFRDLVRRDPAADGHDHRVHTRSEEHTSELQSPVHLVCRLLLEKKKKKRLCNIYKKKKKNKKKIKQKKKQK